MKSMSILIVALGLLVPLYGANAQEPPPGLVEAVARQESGLNPLAINVAGNSFFPATKEEAENIIKIAQAAGKSYDVGLMQINSWWINRYAIPAKKLLDPDFNVEWGTRILTEEMARHGFNWQAVGRYHSPDTERGRQYAWRVYGHYAGQSASTLKEVSNAQPKTRSQNLPRAGGVWRNPDISSQGRVITFDLQQKSMPGVSGTKPGARGVPAGIATP